MRKLITVPYIDQTKLWPTGCECVSAVMLLCYLGIDISVDDFINKHVMKEPMRFGSTLSLNADGVDLTPDPDNIIGTGPDPDECFAGSPYDKDSFGCYPGVIVRALNSCFAEYRAEDATGVTTDRLLVDHIDNGRPVIYWASLCLAETIKGPSWRIGSKVFTWTSMEHCMLLVGHDDEKNTLIFNDPWMNHGTVEYDRELAIKRHDELGGRAVTYK